MKFKRQHTDMVEVNLTPMLDVVFLLLIFFMVSTTFTKESHLTIDLPEATANSESTPTNTIEIVISSSGHYSINGQQLVNQQLDILKRALQKELGQQDRKSTRLNSSHVRISYAVFCLKKKT